ncbi:hypothetical protein [Mucilaginibacter sp.]|uniref:hypothetical protein n=1 Tax=Mucilaginibacter sp. TaxID=1882438 RepID=UPI0025D3A8C4|nr:hypothetical protein [Mucilaginibacter sp.]
MEIKYLAILKNNPAHKFENSDYVKRLEPLTEAEINELEILYNNGNIFPIALRELLFLAGNYCYVLDFGMNDTQQALQAVAKRDLIRYKKSIERPFFAIDVYGGGGQFLFVYLDEGDEDPMVYEADLFESHPWIHSLHETLSQLIKSLMIRFLNGQNPF